MDMVNHAELGLAEELCEKALGGAWLDAGELARLLELSDAAARSRVVTAADALSREAAGGRGFVYAQIGVDRHPCPENCRFCAFAACNVSPHAPGERAEGAAAGRGEHARAAERGDRAEGASVSERRGDQVDGAERAFETPLDDVVGAARVFSDAGAHLVSLMATAALPFPRLAEMVRAVRGVIADDVAVMVNAADMTRREARMLHEAGAQAAYHANRLGEGVITDISPQTRRATMRAVRDERLALMTGVEPLAREFDVREVAQRMEEVARAGAWCTGVCVLKGARGTQMEHVAGASRDQARYVAAVLRLAVGTAVPVGCAGGVRWVDAGADPRARGYADGADVLREKVARARAELRRDGWEVGSRADCRQLMRAS